MVLIIYKMLLLERNGQGIFLCSHILFSIFSRRVFLFTGFTIPFCKGSEDHELEHLSRSEIPAFIGVSVPDPPAAILSEQAGVDAGAALKIHPSSSCLQPIFWKAVDVYAAVPATKTRCPARSLRL